MRPPIPPEATHVSWRRYFAHTVDVFLLLLVVLFVGAVLETVSSVVGVLVIVLGLTVGQVVFFVLTQRRDGRTPGKALFGLRVVDEQGGVPSTGALVRRSLPLIVEYFYVIAWIGMMSSDHRQRFGDRWGAPT